VSNRFVIACVTATVASGASPAASWAAQGHYHYPARHAVVVGVGYYASPWYYDPWFGFYYPWAYPPYAPYGYYVADSSIRLEVKPRQAEVFVDGYYAGIVDDFDGTFQRLRLPPGEHELELYLDGYRTVHQKVYLTADNTFKVKYQMEKLGPGEQAEPRPQPPAPPPNVAPGQNVQPYPGPPVGPGGHRGQRPPEPPGAPQTPSAPGAGEASGYGTLAIRVQPGDADVLVDGERWNAPEGQERLFVELPGGRHTVEIRKAGYRSYITDLDVRSGETTPLNVSLRSQEEQ
jgi:PEGA domain